MTDKIRKRYACVLTVIGICDFETDSSYEAGEHELASMKRGGPIHITRERLGAKP